MDRIPTERDAVETQPTFVLKDGKLCLNANLPRSEYSAFQGACDELIHCALKEVTIDLTACTYVNSLFIGTLVDAVTQMKMNGKQVNVYVSPEVGHFFHMAHLYHLFVYKVIQPAEDKAS